MFKSHPFQCIANIAMFRSHWAQEASLCYWEHIQEPFESTCLLLCHRSFIMHRYVLSVCFLACFGSPGLSGKARLGGIKRPGALCSKQHIAWPRPAHSSIFQLTWGDAYNHTHSCTHTPTHTQLTQLFLTPRHNTVQLRLSFRHRACYRVIALLINVSLSEDNGPVFTIRFSRLAMRDIQWCNLLSVHYALHGSPWGTLFPGSSRVTHLSMHYFPLLQICFSFFREIDLNHKWSRFSLWPQNVIFIPLYNCFLFPIVI